MQTNVCQGGFVDFAPQFAQIRAHPSKRPGPPRTCFLDDLVFYLQEHGGKLLVPAGDPDGDAMADPDVAVGTYVRKIVASHYFKLAEHLRATLSAAQRALSRKHDLASFPMQKVEELWTDIQAWERRMGEYCEDLDAIMLQLGIPLQDPNTSPAHQPGYLDGAPSYSGRETPALSASTTVVSGGLNAPDLASVRQRQLLRWMDSAVDFQFLLFLFRDMRHRTEGLNAAVTGLASITGNRQTYREQLLALETAKRSIREAKSSKAVTLLGLIFIPLAYTSSLFSMSAPYGPGQDQFWQYFVAAVPLIFVVILGYYVLDLGYTDDETNWSLRVFMVALRRKVLDILLRGGRPKQAEAAEGARKQEGGDQSDLPKWI